MCASNSEISQHIQNISLINNINQNDPSQICKHKKECDKQHFIENTIKQIKKSEKEYLNNSNTQQEPQKKFEDIIEETVLKRVPTKTESTETSSYNKREGGHGVNRNKEENNSIYYKSLPRSAQENILKESCNENEKRTRRLLKWKDMPVHLQFNPYIRTGYRPMLSAWGCIHSLFYIHNETFNIITHGMPILYIILKTPSITNWTSSELRFLSWCHVTGIISPWIGSFIYHLFMNMDRDQHFYQRLLQLDMLGIWICQSIGAMPMIYTFSHCFESLMKWSCISFYCLIALWGLYKAMLAISPWERRLCFILPFSLRILLCGFRFLRFGGGDPNALLHLLLQDFIAVIGAIIGALHIPEKWFPGHVDKCWNSHNIMHLFVVAAVYSMHEATMQDLNWVNKVQCISEQFF